MELRTAWENMVCNCKVCEGCLFVEKRKQALRLSAKEIMKIVEKRFADKLYETFNNS